MSEKKLRNLKRIGCMLSRKTDDTSAHVRSTSYNCSSDVKMNHEKKAEAGRRVRDKILSRV